MADILRPFPAFQGDDPYIFVSYAHEDAHQIYPHLEWLRQEGFRIWYDEGINPGALWRDELADRIRRCRLFLFCVTPKSVASRNCQRELNYALDINRQVLAVHLEHTELPEGLKLRIGDLQAILYYETDDASFRNKLLGALRSAYADDHESQQSIADQRPASAPQLAGRGHLISRAKKTSSSCRFRGGSNAGNLVGIVYLGYSGTGSGRPGWCYCDGTAP